MNLQLLFCLLLLIGFVSTAPTKNDIKLRPAQQKVGVADFITLIPGIHRNEICSMCKRVLNAFKKEGMARANQDQTQFRAFVDHECHVLTSGAPKFLPLESLEPFCREMGNTLMDLASTYSSLVTGFIDPATHCEMATFCASSDD